MKRKIFILLLLCLSIVTFGQNSFKGKVVDEKNVPLPYANVVALSLPDSAFVAGTTTDLQGNFKLEQVKEGQLIRISSIGYVTVYKNTSELNEPDIQMSPDVQALQEVVVQGTHPVVFMKGNALVTDVQNSLLSKAGSASDVLARIPRVSKSKDKFVVFGKGTPLIYINGRLVRDNTELEQLNSTDIKHVELLTTPGAQYDASVKSVIRIKTVKRQGDGFSFDVRSSYYQSENTDLIEQANVNYRHAGLDLFGSFDYRLNRTEQISSVEQETNTSSLWQQHNTMQMNGQTEKMSGTFGFNYQINDNHSFGARYQMLGYPSSYVNTDILSKVEKNNDFYDQWSSNGIENRDYSLGHQLNLYYTGTAGKLGIDVNADYYKSDYDATNNTSEQSQEQDDRQIAALNQVKNEMCAGKVVFTYPIWKGQLSFGGEYTYSNRDNNYLSRNESYVPSSCSNISENYIGAFTSYDVQLPFGMLSAGIRYEHVDFEYSEDKQKIDAQSKNFDNVFPTLSFATQFGQVQAQLSYAATIQRPSYADLSNNVFYINRFTLQQGNPYLLPSITHDISLNAMWKYFQFMLSYQQKKDEIFTWSTQTEANPELSTISYINFDRMPTLNAFIGASPTIGFWSPMYGVGVSKQWVNVHTDLADLELKKPALNVMLNNTFTLPKNFLINLDFTFQGKGDYQNIYMMKNMYILNFAISKSFFNDALNVELRGNDLFHQQKDASRVYMNRLTAYQANSYDSREFAITVRYRFNTAQSKYKGSGAGESTRSRF
ncbi:TonB-dependent receptor domain-containing protein [Phocaeicola plebeius]|uniref:TonB-dependent receptor domain-containing protein n=1 Tax=Phocaeicola plebeius TaxID=310297 RepID=UPI003565725B